MATSLGVEYRTIIKKNGVLLLDETNTIPAADGDLEEHFQIPISTTRTLPVTIDNTKIKGYIIESDHAIQVTTNTAPDETIPIAAGIPTFFPGGDTVNQFGHAITALHFINGAGAVANVDFYMFMDNMP